MIVPPRIAPLLALLALGPGCSHSSDDDDQACTPDDADGIISEPARLVVTVTDREFSPKILAAQNSSDITLTLENQGTSPHGFVIDCLPTPNTDGCPTESCFPSESQVEPLAPGESATITFETPLVEGIYDFRSDVSEDAQLTPGQFIVQ
jgi:hypothetical protein